MKKTIRISESDLHKILKETVKSILENCIPKESGNINQDIYVSDKEIDAMEKAFRSLSGEEYLHKVKNGELKIIRGNIYPDREYSEHPANMNGSNYGADAIIEYPDGKLKVLMKKMRLATPKDSFSGLY